MRITYCVSLAWFVGSAMKLKSNISGSRQSSFIKESDFDQIILDLSTAGSENHGTLLQDVADKVENSDTQKLTALCLKHGEVFKIRLTPTEIKIQHQLGKTSVDESREFDMKGAVRRKVSDTLKTYKKEIELTGGWQPVDTRMKTFTSGGKYQLIVIAATKFYSMTQVFDTADAEDDPNGILVRVNSNTAEVNIGCGNFATNQKNNKWMLFVMNPCPGDVKKYPLAKVPYRNDEASSEDDETGDGSSYTGFSKQLMKLPPLPALMTGGLVGAVFGAVGGGVGSHSHGGFSLGWTFGGLAIGVVVCLVIVMGGWWVLKGFGVV